MSHSHSHSHAEQPAPAVKKADDAVSILFVDAVAGVSAPMLLGALIDLGADEKAIQAEVKKIGAASVKFSSKRVSANGIAAVKADVSAAEGRLPFADVIAMIGGAPLADGAKERILKALFCFAEGEAASRGQAVHEVEAPISAIAQIAAVCVALDLVDAQFLLSGPLTVGSASAPGTLAVLKNFPIRKIADAECETSAVGAAIIASLAAAALEPLVMTPKKIGYGAGAKDNVLRLVLADSSKHFLPDSLFPCEECGEDHEDETPGHSHSHSHDHGHSHKH